MIVNINNRKKSRLSGIYVLVFLACILHAGLLKGTPFFLSDEMNGTSLDHHIRYYEDKDGSLTIEDIIHLPESRFLTKEGGRYNIGYSDSVFWFRIDTVNLSDKELTWIIESNYPLLDYISAFIPDSGAYREIASGDRLPFSTMPYGYHNFTITAKTPPGNETYYLRIKSEGSLLVSLAAWDMESLVHNLYRELSLLWFFFGIMVALFCYNIFIYISSKDKTYLALTLFIFSATIYIFIHTGMARKYLWPDYTWWGNHSHPFFLFTSIGAILYFTTLFLNTKENLPKIHLLLKTVMISSIPSAFLSLIIPYSIATKFSTLTTLFTSLVLIFLTMIPMFFINGRLAIYYTLSWVMFPMGTLLMGLRSFGLIEDNFLTGWAYILGIAIGTILLSIAVADKINMLRKENEAVISTLKESEERYRLFFETAHDGIIFFIDNIPVFANKNMIKMTGYREEEFYTKSIYDFFDSDALSDKKTWNTLFNLSRGIIAQKQFEVEMQKYGGDKIDVLISASSLSIGRGRGILLIVTDITYLKEASKIIKEQYGKIQSQFRNLQELNNELIAAQTDLLNANIETEKEKEFLSATLSSIGDGVITYDMSGHVFSINSVAEELTGVCQDEAVGKKIREVVRLNDDQSNDILFSALGKLDEKNRYNNIGIPFKMFDINGVERIIELNSSLIKLKGNPIGIIMVLRDITVKYKIDNEINKMSKLESIGILAGGIAHDFNNLLTGISGNISIAKETKGVSEDLTGIINDIEKATQRATALTKQLLTFAKGGAPLIASVSITEILEESVKLLIKDPIITYKLIIDENIKPALIDPNQISQALNNLLINSLQAMPDGGEIVIKAENGKNIPSELQQNIDYIYLKVSDNGPGIDRKNIKKVFDPFFTTKAAGTGLGLTSTYSIIKKHRGHINVLLPPEGGTAFEIYLPASHTVPVPGINKKRELHYSRQGNILIMDDEQYILQVFVKMLNHLGFTVDCAQSGSETIRIYSEKLEAGERYTYVILDLTIPGGMGGKTTMKELLKIDPEVNAIVSSGYSENPVMANFKKHGFKGILKKPYTLEDIVALFETLENQNPEPTERLSPHGDQ